MLYWVEYTDIKANTLTAPSIGIEAESPEEAKQLAEAHFAAADDGEGVVIDEAYPDR